MVVKHTNIFIVIKIDVYRGIIYVKSNEMEESLACSYRKICRIITNQTQRI